LFPFGSALKLRCPVRDFFEEVILGLGNGERMNDVYLASFVYELTGVYDSAAGLRKKSFPSEQTPF